MTARDGTNRGGYQRPQNPAAVSPPGALSRRTDGGAGQPIRVPTGGPYGSAQAATAQQQGAPLAAGPSGPPTPGGPAPGPPANDFLAGGTQRPSEPITAGVPGGPEPADTDMVLRELFLAHPSPWLARLMRPRV